VIYAIEIDHLYKSHGSFTVLHNLSFRVAVGETYGLLGPHGAGKSTLLHVLLGFLRPSKGKVRVLGASNPETVRQRVGYIPERSSYHMRFTAREYLRFLGTFSNMGGVLLQRRIEEYLQLVGLSEVSNHRLSEFSRGMLQRFGIAQALLVTPELLLLDEPLSGLDTTEQREVIEVLSGVRALGYTLLLCSHYIPALAQLCDRLGVLAEGVLTDEIDAAGLRSASHSIRIQVDQLRPGLRLQLNSISPHVRCDNYTVTLRPNTRELQSRVLRALLDANVTILSLESLEHPLEQFYVQAVRQAPMVRMTESPHTRAAAQATRPKHAQENETLLGSLLSGEQSSAQNRTPDDD
jgi:ABC-2 type transport system ATP-binding protein